MYILNTKRADITQLKVDAIVNSANSTLLAGSGISGAIHRAAGPSLANACRLLKECEVGEARITEGFRLPAKHVIHVVGPRWMDGFSGEAELLEIAYQNAIALAAQHSIRTIAFPNISAGVHGYPPDLAADVAIRAVDAALSKLGQDAIEEVIFCCYTERDLQIFESAVHSFKQGVEPKLCSDVHLEPNVYMLNEDDEDLLGELPGMGL
jgi:O-acetyl-ADP-ribose deacetylase (regulator of RNase III)